MAKNRMVSTRFWDDSYIQKLKPNEKFIFLYLLTNPLTTIAGIYEISMDRIVYDTGLPKKIAYDSLSKFQDDNKIVYLENHVIIINFIKYQSLNPKVEEGIKREIENLPLILRSKISYDSLSKAITLNLTKLNLTKLNTTEPNGTDPGKPKAEDEVLSQWNDFAKENNLTAIRTITDTRKAHIKNRFKEKEFSLAEILEKIRGSDFLLGKVKKWKVDLDFIIKSKDNYIKILEGKYDGKSNHTETKADRINRNLSAAEELMQRVTN